VESVAIHAYADVFIGHVAAVAGYPRMDAVGGDKWDTCYISIIDNNYNNRRFDRGNVFFGHAGVSCPPR
jgi:hypothetical protein